MSDYRYVLAEARRRLAVFYTPRDTDVWLESPHGLLRNRVPLHEIQAGRGKSVLRVIAQLEDGAHL